MRDTYDCGDCIAIVTTDRQSAFDRLLAAVPFKGRVLNATSAWWMAQTAHVARNALLAVPHPNVALMRKCTVFPVEFVGAQAGLTAQPPAVCACPHSRACAPGHSARLHDREHQHQHLDAVRARRARLLRRIPP